jgi:hypothetical protein
MITKIYIRFDLKLMFSTSYVCISIFNVVLIHLQGLGYVQ